MFPTSRGMTDKLPRITLPANGWGTRPYQDKLFGYLENGGKRAIAMWPRRTGKDEVALHHTAVAAHQRVGNYWHCLPEYAQGRKAIWTAVNPHTGTRRIDEAFPQALREQHQRPRDVHPLQQRLDVADASARTATTTTVGSGAAGMVFSEWALRNPSAWAYMRPMRGGEQRLGAVHHHAARPQPRQDHVRHAPAQHRAGSRER